MPDDRVTPLPDDPNPYASPQAPFDPDWTPPSEIEGAWRRGDEMLLVGRRAKTPRACWLSNRTGRVCASALSSEPPKAVVAAALLLAVPVVGLFLLVAYAILTRAQTRYDNARCWLRARALLWYVFLLMISSVLSISGWLGANAAFLILIESTAVAPAFAVYFVALLLLTAGSALAAVIHGILGLEVEQKEDGLLHVRGVHPDYLARLPEYPQQPTSSG